MAVLWWIVILMLAIKAISYLLRWYEVTGEAAFRAPSGVGDQFRRIGGGIVPFLGEFASSLLSMAIWLVETPYRLLTRASGRLDGVGLGTRPVVLVHGFFLTPWSLWLFRRSLLKAGLGPVYLLDYYPALGEIDGFVRQLAELVDRVAPDGRVDLVAHSMGGLIAARYMGEKPERVGRLVAVGTPFHGTRLWAMSVGRALPQMRPGSDFLLQTRQGVAGRLERVTCVYSRFDQIILPYRSSHLEGADSVVVDGLGHNALLFSPTVRRAVVAALVAPNSDGASPEKR